MSEDSTSLAKEEVMELTTPLTNVTIASSSDKRDWSVDQVDWLNNRTIRQCSTRELTYLDLKFPVDPNFEKGLANTIFVKTLEEHGQS